MPSPSLNTRHFGHTWVYLTSDAKGLTN